MEKQNKNKSTEAAVHSFSPQESTTSSAENSQFYSKFSTKNPLEYVHETQHANKEQPTEHKVKESEYFRECALTGTFEDYLKRYPNGRFTKGDFELMKDNYESLKAERIFGYIGAIIGLPFFIIIMIGGLIYDGFKYCDRKCIAIACSMDKYFNFSK